MMRPQDRLPLESPVCVHDWLWVPLTQVYRCVLCKYEILIRDLLATHKEEDRDAPVR